MIVDVQRGGPSTGLPTKTEQSDLFQAVLGRDGEAPVPVVAVRSPSHAFDAAIEACGIALTYRTTVMLLSDGYTATAAEPWRIPDADDPPDLAAAFAFATERNDTDRFLPCRRDPETLARPWVLPGTPGLEHRLGGLEKSRPRCCRCSSAGSSSTRPLASAPRSAPGGDPPPDPHHPGSAAVSPGGGRRSRRGPPGSTSPTRRP